MLTFKVMTVLSVKLSRITFKNLQILQTFYWCMYRKSNCERENIHYRNVAGFSKQKSVNLLKHIFIKVIFRGERFQKVLKWSDDLTLEIHEKQTFIL